MNPSTSFVVTVTIAAGLHLLHRLCLWLEAQGHLYYIHRKPEGRRMACLVELQRALEPEVRYVVEALDQARPRSAADAQIPATLPVPDNH